MDSNCRLSPASCLSVPLEFDTARMLTVMWCRHSRKHPPATVPQTYPDLPNWNGLPVLCQLARASAAASAWRRMELLRPPVAVGQVGKPAVRSSIGPVTLCHESFQHRQSDGHSTSFGKRLHLPDSTSGPQMGLRLERSSTTGGLPPKARPFPGDRSIPDRFRGAHMSKPCATPITVKHPHSRDGSAKPQPTSSSGRINARRPSSVTLRSTNN